MVRYACVGDLVGLLTLGGLCYILETLLYLEDLSIVWRTCLFLGA